MATVFSVFREEPYTFLEITRGNVYGNQITGQRNLRGVFKLRSGQLTSQNMETYESTATLHVHPEDFADIDATELIGQGIRHNGIDYDIASLTKGTNFDTGAVEHITLTLQRAEYGN